MATNSAKESLPSLTTNNFPFFQVSQASSAKGVAC